jgi:hypothetical protein
VSAEFDSISESYLGRFILRFDSRRPFGPKRDASNGLLVVNESSIDDDAFKEIAPPTPATVETGVANDAAAGVTTTDGIVVVESALRLTPGFDLVDLEFVLFCIFVKLSSKTIADDVACVDDDDVDVDESADCI